MNVSLNCDIDRVKRIIGHVTLSRFLDPFTIINSPLPIQLERLRKLLFKVTFMCNVPSTS